MTAGVEGAVRVAGLVRLKKIGKDGSVVKVPREVSGDGRADGSDRASDTG